MAVLDMGSGAPHHDFVFQPYAISLFDAVADVSDQFEHVASAGTPGVDKEVGVAVADTGVSDAQTLEPQLVDHAAGRRSRRILEDATGAFLPHGLAGAPLFVADANSLNYFTVRFGGKIQRHCEHHIIRRKRSVTVFKGNLITPEDFYLAAFRAIDLDLFDITADLRSVSAGIHAQSAANRTGHADQPFQAAKVVLGTERHGAAKVGGGIDMSQIAFENHVGIGLGQLQHDPRQLPIADEKVGTASKEPVRNIRLVKQVENRRDGFVLTDTQEVGRSADAERSQFGQANTGLERDARFRQ